MHTLALTHSGSRGACVRACAGQPTAVRAAQELLEGVMMKRGTGMFVAWKERLFLLTSKQLVYFDSGRFSATKGSMLLREIKTFDMALPVSKYGKKFCLALTSSGATWVVRTDTESDFIRWRDAMRRKISVCRLVAG